MATTSIYFYNWLLDKENPIKEIYNKLSKFNEDSIYFDVKLHSSNEISGKFIFTKNVETIFFNPEIREFESRTEVRANVVYFNFDNKILDIYGNKAGTNRLTFILSSIFDNSSLNLLDVDIQNVIERLKYEKVTVNRVSFEDFIFSTDIIGNFSVDLSEYGDAFSILSKYKKNIAKLTFTLACEDTDVKLTLNSKGSLIMYKDRKDIDDYVLGILKGILLKEML